MKEIESLDQEAARPDFWNDNEAAQKVLQKRVVSQRPVMIKMVNAALHMLTKQRVLTKGADKIEDCGM